MPLMFRSVLSFTLPGVLALFGWWWYNYRKKEQITVNDSPKGAPDTMGNLTSPTEDPVAPVKPQTPETETFIRERLTFLQDSMIPIVTSSPILPTLSSDQDSVSAPMDSESNQLDQEREVCDIAPDTDTTYVILAATPTSPLVTRDENEQGEAVGEAPFKDAYLPIATDEQVADQNMDSSESPKTTTLLQAKMDQLPRIPTPYPAMARRCLKKTWLRESSTEFLCEDLDDLCFTEALSPSNSSCSTSVSNGHKVSEMDLTEDKEMPNGCPLVPIWESLNVTPTENSSEDCESSMTHPEDIFSACGVNSVDLVDGASAVGAMDSQVAVQNFTTTLLPDTVVWEIRVPKHLVGRLIGKQGRCVNFLKQSSGTKIFIRSVPYSQEFQICHIEGTMRQVDKVLSLIRKKFKDLDLSNMYISPTPPTLAMDAWLVLPTEVPVRVTVVNIVNAGTMFIQQHTHPTFYALESLEQEMLVCYSQPFAPILTSPVQSMICVAPGAEQAWWRAQIMSIDKEADEVKIRYLDNGGYVTVKTNELRKIRSDFVKLPFQSLEVILNNFDPLPGQEAVAALEEMTQGAPLIVKSVGVNEHSIPLVDIWNVTTEPFLINNMLVEKGHGIYTTSMDIL